tara:strand:- start:14059 stop:14304 length:246 start_codon:yes stop_codon:yes gene_type:complete
MELNIHTVKEIEKSEIKERIRDNGEKYYVMSISIAYDELGTCRERRSVDDSTMFGDMEVVTNFSLYAETREALEFKVKALT